MIRNEFDVNKHGSPIGSLSVFGHLMSVISFSECIRNLAKVISDEVAKARL